MENKEIEYKYWATEISSDHFRNNLQSASKALKLEYLPDCVYVVSCDDYYEEPAMAEKTGAQFIRYRKGGNYHELTVKRKQEENVVRDEINVDVSGNSETSIANFLSLLGYTKTFQVYKEAWIWHFEDCVVSYYTLSDGRSVIELEAIKYTTINEGISIINKWEKLLQLQNLERESRSLFEIYTEEAKNS